MCSYLLGNESLLKKTSIAPLEPQLYDDRDKKALPSIFSSSIKKFLTFSFNPFATLV